MRRKVALAAGTAIALASAVALSIPTVFAGTAPADAQVAAATPLAPPTISVGAVKAHLQQFQSIASSNGGNRYSGRPGYTASLNYVEGKVRAAGYTVTRQTCSSGCTSGSVNLIAEWKGGDANQVLMLGAHLDGVAAGPGINDNGSGSGAILEVALALAAQNPTMTKRVRFAWWSDEEQGLRGSRFYVSQLSATDRSRIKGYLNFDMVGSRNAGYFINNISTPLAQSLKAYYDKIGVSTEENVEGANRSDDASFRNAGIASSGVAAGASARKTSAQAQKWGGTANAAYDSCYHAACDTISNVADTPLDRASNAIATAVWSQAVGTPPNNEFSISVSPGSGSVDAGAAATTTVSTQTTAGTAQSVALSATGLPSGASATFTPSTVTSGATSSLRISTSASTPAGSYPVTVTGTGTMVARTTTCTLTVNGTPPGDNFSLSLSSGSGAVDPGGAVSTTVNTATTSGSAQSVALSASGLPAGASATFSPTTVTSGGSASLQISTSASTPAGSYTITVTGTGSVTRTATYALTVNGTQPGGCNGVPAWSATTGYVPGDKVSYNGRLYNSTWYSTGAEPGAAGSWAVWSDAGPC